MTGRSKCNRGEPAGFEVLAVENMGSSVSVVVGIAVVFSSDVGRFCGWKVIVGSLPTVTDTRGGVRVNNIWLRVCRHECFG